MDRAGAGRTHEYMARSGGHPRHPRARQLAPSLVDPGPVAILEEGVHLMAGYALFPTWATVLRHWSAEFVGVNLYPWLLFPLLTVGDEFMAWWIARPHSARTAHPPPSGTEE